MALCLSSFLGLPGDASSPSVGPSQSSLLSLYVSVSLSLCLRLSLPGACVCLCLSVSVFLFLSISVSVSVCLSFSLFSSWTPWVWGSDGPSVGAWLDQLQ